MPFKKGDPNINRKGRPPKERSLSDQLEKAGNRSYEFDGKRISGKRLLARLMWELAIYGRVELLGTDGKKVVLRIADTKEWLGIAKQIYSQVDGPPKGEFDVNADGIIRFIVDYEDDELSDNSTETT